MSDSILETLDRVSTSARTGANPETRVVRNETELGFGEYIRQGDVYIQRLPLNTELPGTSESKRENPAQLAPGNTVGSRHILRSVPEVKILDRVGQGELAGPVFYAPNGFYLEHPKHADVDCSLPGCYEVSFPVDKHADELGEIRRRRD